MAGTDEDWGVGNLGSEKALEVAQDSYLSLPAVKQN